MFFLARGGKMFEQEKKIPVHILAASRIVHLFENLIDLNIYNLENRQFDREKQLSFFKGQIFSLFWLLSRMKIPEEDKGKIKERLEALKEKSEKVTHLLGDDFVKEFSEEIEECLKKIIDTS